ncbi:Signal recognition particle receptor protein FtsY [Minicystis rosea]|nr:Signal recognition particle receptor protein FtsY [Minicystis rosea]
MEPTYIIIGLVVLVIAVVAYFVLLKKPAQTPEIEAPPEEKKLPEKAPAPAPVEAKPAPKAQKPAPQPKAEKPERVPEKAPEAKKAPEPKVEKAPEPVVERVPEPKIEKPAAPPPPSAKVEKPAPSARKRDVEGLRKGLAKVREKEGFFGRLKALFTGRKEIDPQIVEQIEEVLLTSDVGVKTTQTLLDEIKHKLEKNELSDNDKVWDALREHASSILSIGGGGIALTAKPTVVMVVGVNGVGKTTTIGKLATKLKAEGKKVVLAAGDTFRAAAVQQLKVWGKRVDVEVVAGKDGANPGAVIFDAIQRAKEIGADVVLADTAGRLHTKTNLMEELTKVARTMTKAMDGAPHETLLVLDATNGQNAMQQAGMFKEALPLSGIVLTKLDGTAKGGVILGICSEYELPVRYIGIGERAEDLRDFIPEEFVEAMLGQNDAA